MGFTEYEKYSILKMIRSDGEITLLRDHELLPQYTEFLRSEGLLNQMRDYAIIPTKYRHRITKAENIVLCKFLNLDFNFFDFLTDSSYSFTPPLRIQIDCSMLIATNNFDADISKFRFVWPQRNLAFNVIKNINTQADWTNLLNEFKDLSNSKLLRTVCINHQNQACFDRSGYVPMQLLTASFYLSKNGMFFE